MPEDILQQFIDHKNFDGYSVEPEVLRLLRGLVASCPQAKVVVETGTWRGFSAAAMALGLQLAEAKVYTIDVSPPDNPDTQSAFSLWMEHGLQEKIVFYNKTGVEAAADLKINPDIIFFDSDHSTENAIAEWEAWKPYLKPNAITLWHDLWSDERKFKAFLQIGREYHHGFFPTHRGLGILWNAPSNKPYEIKNYLVS